MKIKDITSENRPRERMMTQGAESLSNTELIAIILQKGTKEFNALDLANQIISMYGLEKLSQCSLQELMKIKGIGKAKATQIQAVFELHKRIKTKKNGTQIKNAKDVYDYCEPMLRDKDKEHFMILHLNTKNQVIKHETISIGTLNASIVHPREIFKSAIKENANAIILVHNHPSGDPEPSPEDEEITHRLEEAGELLNIKILDHVIIAEKKFYTFKK
ncbi:DNA repair protein RadC [Candidatus Woesearchaeota archaeon]|jgi:DNA repair protein RadC|nr:DNA repair protein RadC [Candidatus Woesearchaeota archaeon]